MKTVSIKYSTTNSTQFEISGLTRDAAYRKVLDGRGNPVHTATGRLTEKQFIARCLKNGVRIDSIHEKGAKVYVACRNKEKALDAIKRMQAMSDGGELIYGHLDLSNLNL